MSLLTIIANACSEVGVPTPSSIIGNSDQNVVQMFALLNREGRYLARAYEWRVLRAESSFTTLAAAQQVADMTSFTDSASASVTDWDRFVAETMFDRTENRQLLGPVTPPEWQFEKATIAVGVQRRYYMRGKALFFTPTPPAGNSIYFEYVKKNWCQSSGLVGKQAFSIDSDTGILDEDLLTQAVVWRYLKAKGFDYAEEFRRYEHLISTLTSAQSPSPRLSVTPRLNRGLTDGYVKDGNWP